jgi:hypothetical protein
VRVFDGNVLTGLRAVAIVDGQISTGFVESAINQVVSQRMVKKQQMGRSRRGAHLLLQIRTRVLDEERENTFRTWYPDFLLKDKPKKAA